MAKKQFKAESKRLLDLMINSIYTNREIFLRELISNASDALDKRHYLSLTDENNRVDDEELGIRVEIDKEARTLTIMDTGIGMTDEELENNLGTIAKSGSLEFKKQLEENKDVDIIGQFGVGFYSAFMVAKEIIVDSRSVKDAQAHRWQSSGEDGYSISDIDKDEIGTTIILKIKDSSEEDNYDEFLESWNIQQLIKKYSDYIRYPIVMDVETQRKKENPAEGEEEWEDAIEERTINSMIPLWKRSKNDIKPEEYNDFYKSKFMDFVDPAEVIHYSLEGTPSYTALLYVPGKAPYNFYSSEYQSGLQLYCKGVFIMDNAKDLLPDHFRFVRGLVDSDDLNLNISREILQQDRQMKAIAKSLEKKIKTTLQNMLKNDREKYEEFFSNFGLQLKFGVYDKYGANKETLKDLVMWKSSYEEKYTTLKEYVERMKEDQKYIYYAAKESIEMINLLPQMELLKEKGYEVLYFTDDVDEFAIRMMMNYDEKEFKSITQGDLELESEEEKKEKEEIATENKSLLEAMTGALSEKVKEVRLSSRLKSHPVCLVSDDGLSMEMEKVLAQNPEGSMMKASQILEINPNHPIFNLLQKAYEEKPETVKKYTELLYNQARLIEGLDIKNPVEYANQICDLMIKANQ